ncbi:hypothetical protein FA95DRAFT_1674341 [Auriscalpium vulgare]|uniref:Uncharacterized protein n=1 Tax=Auriscalpium vulgare TaxID=40419 RepID=A0ACB8S9Y6_9AGAM|nr:hypothetical protein FA95DRAFT_1674341 [Auriscalpium vulgare]
MVRFGFSAKSPPSSSHRRPDAPPPPYDEQHHDPPLILGGTTTTTQVITTTTQTTTHFFSLPLWRRRHPSPSATTRRSLDATDAAAPHPFRPTSALTMSAADKDLPPTPGSSTEDLASSSNQGDDPMNHADHGFLSSPSRPHFDFSLPATHSPRKSTASQAASSQPTIALAHAALGLGLPHVMPRASASSSTSDVAFMSAPSDDGMHPLQVRRTKSFQKLNTELSSEERAPTGGKRSPRPRRLRGMSLGTNTYGENQEKDAAREEKEVPVHVTPPRKSLTRRASFWNRKRNDSLRGSKTSLAPTPPKIHREPSPQPTLPALPPISPFDWDTNATSVSVMSQSGGLEAGPVPSPPGLVRSYSEHHSPRSHHSPPAIPPSSDTGRPRRPSTADATVDRPRARSMFVDQPDDVPVSRSPPPLPSPIPLLETPPESTDHPTLPPARPRAHTNPPLLHRLSVNLLFNFSSSSSSAVTASPSNLLPDGILSQSQAPSPRTSTSRPPSEIPKPNIDVESPEFYVSRLIDAVSKGEVATALARSGDEFYAKALLAYISRFDFTGDPLDVALRKLLMDVSLPRETQQIDRVMEAFAARYRDGNPRLFASEDHPYILAFSLIMLHTDAFNKSNKRKMTKANYVKNTKLPGVPVEVLDCFYDNIVFAPFIFIEDPLDVNGQRGLTSDNNPPRLLPGGISSQHSLPGNGSSVTLLGRVNKIDPYYLITKNLLGPLRVDVDAYVPYENPYSHEGTGGRWDEAELRRAFAKAGVIEVGAADRRMSTSLFAVSVGGLPSPYANFSAPPDLLYPTSGSDNVSALKVTKVGLLNRQDVTLEGGKRTVNKKWKEWSVILTGSQLLFFRDPIWANNLLDQATINNGQLLFPPVSLLKPDELVSVNDSVAVYDRAYNKHYHTFRFVMKDGRHFLLQASNKQEMNEWISRINYASTFKTAGVRIRALGISGKDVELMGVAAAASHLRDMKSARSDPPAAPIRSWESRTSDDFVDRLSNSPSSSLPSRPKTKAVRGRDDMDLEIPTAPQIDGAHQFKATFEQVKADLAAGRLATVDDVAVRAEGRPRAYSLESIARPAPDDVPHQRISSRTQIVRSKIRDLEQRLLTVQSQLDVDVRLIRNIGVLTPFQRSTRERLETVVRNVAKRIRLHRLQVAKLTCHRDVLANDLIAEERDWHRTKTIALKAATETLQSRRDPSIARMPPPMLQLDDPEPFVSSPREISTNPGTPSHRPESSSASESFHSALDFDWSLDSTTDDTFEGMPRVDSPVTTPVFDHTSESTFSLRPTLSRNGASSSSISSLARASPLPFPAGQIPGHAIRTSSGDTATPERVRGHEKYTTAPEGPEEEAEDWNKTRAAKRVSLVRLPADLKMSKGFGRGDPDSASWATRSPGRSPPAISEA